MKLKNIILTTLLIAISMSCSSDKKTVGEYKYGVITKGEMTRRAQGVKLNPQLEKTLIESLAVEGMARNEALANGYDKNDIYLLRIERESWPVLKKIVNEKNLKSLDLSWEYVKCRSIAFQGNSENTRNKAFDKAKKVIELLGKGAKFDSLIKSYSSNPQNAVEASTLYVVKGGGRSDFENAVYALSVGSYTTEPVVMSDGTAVVIISDEKGTLTLDNLEKKVTVPNEQKRLSAMLEGIAYTKLVSEIEKNNSASFKAITFPDKDSDVMFSVAGKDYTFKDLKQRRDLFSGIIREPLENKNFLLGFAREWYFSILYKTEAEKKGYLKDEKSIAEMKVAADFILANDYIRYVCEKEIIISEKDMLEEYSKNKTHYMKKPESESKKTVQLSYNDAKVFVRKKLVQSRVTAAMDQWRKKALADSELVIK